MSQITAILPILIPVQDVVVAISLTTIISFAGIQLLRTVARGIDSVWFRLKHHKDCKLEHAMEVDDLNRKIRDLEKRLKAAQKGRK